MKEMKCDICDHVVTADSFEEWMDKMKPHYGTSHADFMNDQASKSEEEKMSDTRSWMEENKNRFDSLD